MKINVANAEQFINEVKNVVNEVLNTELNSVEYDNFKTELDNFIQKIEQIEKQYNISLIVAKNHCISAKTNLCFNDTCFIVFLINDISKYCSINDFDTNIYLSQKTENVYIYEKPISSKAYTYYLDVNKDTCLRLPNESKQSECDFVIYAIWWHFDTEKKGKYKIDCNTFITEYIKNKLLQLLELPYYNSFAIAHNNTDVLCITLEQLQLICNYLNHNKTESFMFEYVTYYNYYVLLFNNELSIKLTQKTENEHYAFFRDFRTDIKDKYKYLNCACIEQY